MKYIITGLHSSGKLEVLRQLSKDGVRVGKMMTNLDSIPYSGETYEWIPTDEMNRIFENGAYVYFSEVNNSITNDYECLPMSEFDTCDVFAMSPNQVNNLPMKALPDKVCFVWMDCNTAARTERFKNEKRQYNFKDREDLERLDLSDFVDKMYQLPNSEMVYFQNEEPQRVAAIVETMVKYPQTAAAIIRAFKN